MQTSFTAIHVTLTFSVAFDEFTERLETALGRLDSIALAQLVQKPAYAKARLQQLSGEQDLILFEVQDHGQLFALLGQVRKARLYTIGNPLTALEMTQHDLRAGLYAPLRVLVYEAPDHTVQVEYDLPSSLFGQFGNAEVTQVAESLDERLHKVLTNIS